MLLNILSKIKRGRVETAKPTYERVEIIRQRLMSMAYSREQDEAHLRSCFEKAIVANAHEGLLRTDEDKAFDEMLIEMRVPIGELTMQCRNDYLGFILEGHAG